jgi:2-methylaconitate cis-trans-isomerase PrpF
MTRTKSSSTSDADLILIEGDFRIDGVPGTGSKILLDFIGSGGSVTGKLCPPEESEKRLTFRRSGV